MTCSFSGRSLMVCTLPYPQKLFRHRGRPLRDDGPSYPPLDIDLKTDLVGTGSRKSAIGIPATIMVKIPVDSYFLLKGPCRFGASLSKAR
jgi:hypothetical protein